MRILFLTPRFPYPPMKGDSLRTYHQIKALSGQHEITLLSMSEGEVNPDDYRHIADLCRHVEVVPLSRGRAMLNVGLGLPSRLPLQVSYYRSPEYRRQLDTLLVHGGFDVMHATLIRMLPYVWRLGNPPVMVDLIDSLTLNLEDRRGKVRGPKRLGYELEYRRVRDYEQRVVRHFPALAVSSPADKQSLGGSARISVIPNGVDGTQFPFQRQDGRDPQVLIFTGNMGYHPNEEAVVWFVSHVWPRLRMQHPHLRFQIVGTNPGERVRGLADGSNGVEVLGKVPDVAEYLGKATVAVTPMHTGSGIQNKVLEAMSSGTPVASTSIANRGVGAMPERDLLVADSADEFAAAVTRLLDDSGLRSRMAEAGRLYIEQQFRWEQHGERLEQIYRRITQGNRQPALDEKPLVLSGL